MATNVRSVNGSARDLPKAKLDAVEKQRCQDALATLWEILGREQAYLKSLAEKEAQKKVFTFFHYPFIFSFINLLTSPAKATPHLRSCKEKYLLLVCFLSFFILFL